MVAAAAIGSSFSTSIRKLKCDPVPKLISTRMLHAGCISHNVHNIEPLSFSLVSQKWRNLRLIAAVAQEEATAALLVSEQEAGEKAQESVREEVSSGEGEVEAVVNTKLYFGNLPYHCDSAQLAGIIQDYGSPELIEVLYDRETGRSRGFAFVTMSSLEDCETVIQNLDGREYGGRTLRVNFSDKPKPKGPLYPETDHKLFVGNLSWSVTSESLAEVFQEYGNVVGARVLFDGETGRSRGYGFVSYSTKSEMESALESLNGVVRSQPFLGLISIVILHWNLKEGQSVLA